MAVDKSDGLAVLGVLIEVRLVDVKDAYVWLSVKQSHRLTAFIP